MKLSSLIAAGIATFLSVHSHSIELSWDDAGISLISQDPGYTSEHAKWIRMLENGDTLKVSGETMASLDKGDISYITGRIFVESCRIRKSFSDYESRLRKLGEKAETKDVALYMRCLREFFSLKDVWEDLRTESVKNPARGVELHRRASERETALWQSYKAKAQKELPYLALLVSLKEIDLDLNRELTLAYLNRKDDREAKLYLLRLYMKGKLGALADNRTGKDERDQWGYPKYIALPGNAPEYTKAFELAEALLKSKPSDTRPYYYMAYGYVSRHFYESNPPSVKKGLMDSAVSCMKKFLTGKNLSSRMRTVAEEVIKTRSAAPFFRAG